MLDLNNPAVFVLTVVVSMSVVFGSLGLYLIYKQYKRKRNK